MLTVKIGDRLYQMDADKADKLLAIASEAIPCGIYAIRKKGYLELHNDRMSKTQLRLARRHYKKLGFKVYANG